jgi:hypothetical protein
MIHTRVTLGLLAILATALMLGCATSPPVQEMSDARQAIAAAEDADADTLATGAMNDARDYLVQAESQIRSRSFVMARTNAIRAKNRAVDALQASQAASESGDN